MPQKANDCHNHLKLKTKAQICYFLLFLSVFFSKISGEEKTKKQPDYCPETHYSVYLLTNNKLHELKSQET